MSKLTSPMDHNRRTGRTFRCLLTALLAASEGENVEYIALNEARCRELWEKCLGMAWGYSPYVVQTRQFPEIHLHSGKITFVSAASNVIGVHSIRPVKVVCDDN